MTDAMTYGICHSDYVHNDLIDDSLSLHDNLSNLKGLMINSIEN